jgi:hypothetical protein
MKYPDDFDKHESAVDVGSDEINQMIRMCVDLLNNDPDRPDAEIGTGNTIVQVLRMARQCEEDESGEVYYEARVKAFVYFP